MSNRVKTCKRACYRGVKRIRQTFWRTARQKERTAVAQGREPEPSRHRHTEKWDRE